MPPVCQSAPPSRRPKPMTSMTCCGSTPALITFSSAVRGTAPWSAARRVRQAWPETPKQGAHPPPLPPAPHAPHPRCQLGQFAAARARCWASAATTTLRPVVRPLGCAGQRSTACAALRLAGMMRSGVLLERRERRGESASEKRCTTLPSSRDPHACT